ncbi:MULTISPECIES: hypothetical protein [Cytobacillus]|uniref:Uncharacterized protein n=1 Tax=Cytobacillus kochii TaxID=859143 RepID=A0A248THX9_9BACI|nr:hypothetical protein [Cytobacillus kochii]ASV67816.1 hypothetical protein CKF48_11160 [Cytobacillus kochii]
MKDVTFSTNLLFFWVKGKIEIDKRFIKTDLSNTILGFLPAGKDQQNIPLKNISGSMLSSKYYLKPMIFGLILFFIGMGVFANSFLMGLIFLILGVGIAGNGIQTILLIEKSGSPYIIRVPFFEKGKMQQLNNHIHDALADDTDKTDLNLFFDKKTV